MANTLMFEVGVKEAGSQLTDLENRLKNIVDTYGSLKIKVEVDNLREFVNALKTIGNGEQLKPLLDRIDALQTSLTKINGSMGNVDMSSLEKQLNYILEIEAKIKKTKDDLTAKGVSKLNIENATATDRMLLDTQIRTLEKNFGMTVEQAKHYIKTAETAGNASSKLEGNIERLSQSITELSGKTFSVNMGNEFKTWAEQVQALVAQVKELVAQFEKLHSVQRENTTSTNTQAQTQQIDAQTQAVTKESEAYKQLAQWREQAEKFHKDFGKTGLDIVDWHAHSHIAFPKTMRNGDGAAFTDYDVIKNHVYALKEEATLLKERQALIDKYSSVSDVGQKQRYNQILSVYNEVYDAMQKLKQEEGKPAPQGGIFDPQKFTTLQEAIDKIIGEINRLKEALAGIGKIDGLADFKTSVNGLQVEVNNLVTALSKISGVLHIDKSADEITAWEKKIAELKTQYEQLQAQVQQTTTTIQQQASAAQNSSNQDTEATKKANIERSRQAKLLAEVQAMYEKIANLSASGTGLKGQNITSFGDSLKKLIQELGTIPPNRSLQEIAAEFGVVKTAAKSFFTEINKEAKAADNLRNVRLALKLINEQLASGQSNPKLEALRHQLQAINKEMSVLKKAGNFDAVQQLFTGHKGMSDGAINIIRQMVSEMKKLGASTQETASITSHLTAEEQKLAQAIGHSSQQMRGQSQVLSDLKTMAMQYLSVWGAQSFLGSIIEIGGQLEQQRMSIGAILGDTAHANDLFEKIKAQALQSPFGVVELDQMTKQLSAYGFEYNELFDMTKRMADISAATGTSVDRLALALGHVRNEAALSGYTLRQFSMANIPLAKKLSEHLSEVEKRFVSVAEVRKRVSKKEIGYEEVVNVLKDLTNEGGMFYNMQETISKSVKARFKNLRDAMDIMYGEIAESSFGSGLKDLAAVLTELTRHWKELGAVMMAGATIWGVQKLAMIAMNKQIAVGNIATGQFTAKQLEMQAMTGNLSRKLLLQAVATRKMSVETAVAAGNVLGLTEAQLRNVAATGKVSSAYNMATLSTSRFTVAQLRLMATFKSSSWMSLTKYTTAWQIGLAGVSRAASGLAMTLKSLIFNPTTLVMAGVGVLVDLYQRSSQEAEKAKEVNDDLFNRAQEGIKNIKKIFDETDIRLKIDGVDVTDQFDSINKKGAYYTHISAKDLDTAGMMSYMDKWERFIQEYSAMPNHLLNDAYKDESGSVRNLADQYEELYKKVRIVADSYRYLKQLSGAIEYAENSTNGYFDESLITNMNDYAKAVKKYDDSISDLYKNHSQSISSALQAAKSEKAFSKAIEDRNAKLKAEKKQQLTEVEQLKMLVDNQDKYTDAVKRFESVSEKLPYKEYEKLTQLFHSRTGLFGGLLGEGGIFDFANGKSSAFETMKDDMAIWAESVKQKMNEVGWDFNKLNDSQKEALAQAIAEMVSKVSYGTEDIRNEIKNLAYEKFNIKIDDNVADVAARVAGLKNSLHDLVYGKDSKEQWHINVGSNFSETVSNIKKEYKAAKAFFKDNKSIGIKFGLEMTGNMKALGLVKRTSIINDWKKNNPGKDSTLYESFLADYDDFATKMNEALGFKKETGIDLDDNKNKGKGEDKNAKAVREQVRVMKEAADAFQYWREKVGDAAAWAHVEAEFGDVLKKIGVTAKNVNDLRNNLKNVPNLKEYKSIKDKKVKTEIDKEIAKEQAQLNRKDFEKTTEEFASKVQIELDSLTRAWEIFNNVREATGNVELAVQISGADYAGGKTRNLADALREKIQKDFDAAGGGIAFDMNLSGKDIEESIKRSMPAARQEQIKGLVDEYKKWRDLQRDVLKNDIDVFAKLVGGSKDYESQIQKINDGLEKQVAALNEVAKNNPEKKKDVDKAIGAATAQAEYDKWKLSTQYINLMNNSLSLTRKEVDEGINVAMQRLNDLMQHNSISAQEYADEMAKIQNIQSEFTKNSFFGSTGAWASGMMGGLSGLRNFYQSQLNSSTIIKSDLKNKWKQRGLDRKEWEQYEEASNNITSSSSKLEDLNRLESLTSSFDALAKAIDPVINLFNKLGMTGIGSILGMGQSALQSASSMGIGAAVLTGSATAGMWGAGIGAGLIIAGSIADSLFGGLDDALQKEIEASKQRQKEMENMSKNLETALDRALGGVYNVGNTEQGQKAMADFNKNIDRYRQEIKAREEYETKKAQAEKEIEEAKKSGNSFDIIKANNKLASVEIDEKMRNWTGAIKYLQETTVDAIKKADETGKYYDMQRASMMVQRDELQHQIDAEDDKKDSDSGAISDMQQQIKEIEDQLYNFAKDMAKALYDIDVQDWASQLGDALYEAWKKGEDGAEAFKKKASEIIGSITKNILVKKLIETQLLPVEKAIVDMMNQTSGELNEEDFAATVGSMLTESIGKIVPVMESTLNAVDEAVQKSGLPSLKDNADSSLSGNIKGITENTADLLASYLNAIRADVSVNRMELINIRENYLKDIKTQITSASLSLGKIESHTQAIMKSNDAIYRSLSGMISDLKNGNWRVPVS